MRGCVFVAAYIALGCTSKPAENVIARQFTLVDSGGRVTARLATTQGRPRLELLDSAGHARAALFLEGNGTPDLYLYDTHGRARLAVNLCDNGTGNTAYVSADGASMALSYLDQTRHFRVALLDIGRAESLRGAMDFMADSARPLLQFRKVADLKLPLC